jgi:SAM-dependent methyltransferase
MTHGFDKDYWESHWQQAHGRGAGHDSAPNPYLATETVGLVPGTALDAGCGEGAEAIWLAAQGWQVTAADISSEALARARERAAGSAGFERVEWVEADLSVWEPDQRFDLVTTHYAHPAMPQLAFYERLSDWVAPDGTLLIVGHLHTGGNATHGHGHPPEEASVTAASITARLDAAQWNVVTADEHVRTFGNRAGPVITLYDVVVCATRRIREPEPSRPRPGTAISPE